MQNPWKITTLSLVIILVLLAGILTVQFVAIGRSAGTVTQGALSAPSGGNPFGGASVGSYTTQTSGHTVTVTATLSQPPANGKVYEGWLVDPSSGYKLSIGLLDGTQLHFSQSMVNPSIYKVVVITLEDPNKTNPGPSGVIVGGGQLPQGFGQ